MLYKLSTEFASIVRANIKNKQFKVAYRKTFGGMPPVKGRYQIVPSEPNMPELAHYVHLVCYSEEKKYLTEGASVGPLILLHQLHKEGYR